MSSDAAMQSMNVQAQIRRNAEEQGSFLRSMGEWEKEIKVKDKAISSKKVPPKVRGVRKAGSVPPPPAAADPVRISGGTVKVSSSGARPATAADFSVSSDVQSTIDSKKRKPDEKGVFLGTGMANEPTPASLGAPHLVNVGRSVPKPVPRRPTEDLEAEERARGNDLFKKGDYEGAVKAYTRCLGINSRSGVAFSNRAMANLKLKDFSAAEKDATSALGIDPTHVKS
ncbi:hypothetical protein TeGR_g6787, partial [Tetraparma gracilis]